MPKRRQQVGEEELTSGLKGFGSLDQITEHKPRRDSPFRDTREVEPEATSERLPEKVVAMRPVAAEPRVEDVGQADQTSPLPSNDPAQRELLERARAARERALATPEPRPLAKVEHAIPKPTIEVETRQPPRTIEEAAREVRVLETSEAEHHALAPGPRKADLYSERVTLLMSSDMRDRIEALAKELQRQKTTKSERITSNTVMRVAINAFLETFELADIEVANTEEELEEFVRNQTRWKQGGKTQL